MTSMLLDAEVVLLAVFLAWAAELAVLEAVGEEAGAFTVLVLVVLLLEAADADEVTYALFEWYEYERYAAREITANAIMAIAMIFRLPFLGLAFSDFGTTAFVSV